MNHDNVYLKTAQQKEEMVSSAMSITSIVATYQYMYYF